MQFLAPFVDTPTQTFGYVMGSYFWFCRWSFFKCDAVEQHKEIVLLSRWGVEKYLVLSNQILVIAAHTGVFDLLKYPLEYYNT